MPLTFHLPEKVMKAYVGQICAVIRLYQPDTVARYPQKIVPFGTPLQKRFVKICALFLKQQKEADRLHQYFLEVLIKFFTIWPELDDEPDRGFIHHRMGHKAQLIKHQLQWEAPACAPIDPGTTWDRMREAPYEAWPKLVAEPLKVHETRQALVMKSEAKVARKTDRLQGEPGIRTRNQIKQHAEDFRKKLDSLPEHDWPTSSDDDTPLVVTLKRRAPNTEPIPGGAATRIRKRSKLTAAASSRDTTEQQ